MKSSRISGGYYLSSWIPWKVSFITCSFTVKGAKGFNDQRFDYSIYLRFRKY